MRTKLRAGATDLTPTQRTALLGSLIGVYTSNQWCRQLLFSTVDFTSDDAFRFECWIRAVADYALLSTLTFRRCRVLFSRGASDRADAVADPSQPASGPATAGGSAIFIRGRRRVARLAGRGHGRDGAGGLRPLGRAFLPINRRRRRRASGGVARRALAAVSTRLDDAIGWRGAFAVAGAVRSWR